MASENVHAVPPIGVTVVNFTLPCAKAPVSSSDNAVRGASLTAGFQTAVIQLCRPVNGRANHDNHRAAGKPGMPVR
jgi:hypothetical protein